MSTILPFNIVYVHMAVVAATYGLYPLIVRDININGTASAIIMATASIIPLGFRTIILGEITSADSYKLIILAVSGLAMGATLYSMIGQSASGSEISKLFFAGLLMGIGFSSLIDVSLSPAINISISMPIIDIVMLTILVLGGIFYFKEIISIYQLIGLSGTPAIIFLLQIK